MATASDYLNLSELRELAEIEGDLASIRAARKELNTRKATIKHRAGARLAAAQAATGARL